MKKKYGKEFEAWAKRWQLDDEEREILASSERGEWKPLPKKEFEAMKKGLQKAARHTLEKLRKSESVSIRFNPNLLRDFKARAAEDGLPYQTLLHSLAHKYTYGKKSA